MTLITTFSYTSYETGTKKTPDNHNYMLTISRKKALIPIKEYYFSEDPACRSESELLTVFIQAKKPLKGFIPFISHLINLSDERDTLHHSMSKSTRYKIKRAERNRIEPHYDPNPTPDTIAQFKEFYDRFAQTKDLSPCNTSKMSTLGNNNALLLSYAVEPSGTKLVGHAYIVDQNLGRIRLLYSASHFRNILSTTERNAIGMANRFLHWQDILYCKTSGYNTYDLGGVALASSDLQKKAIGRFKAEFGGTPTTEFNGYTSNNYLLKRLLPTLTRNFR